MLKTGGGESDVPSLSALEDKVMNILEKTAVEGLKQGVGTAIKQIKQSNVLINSFGVLRRHDTDAFRYRIDSDPVAVCDHGLKTSRCIKSQSQCYLQLHRKCVISVRFF